MSKTLLLIFLLVLAMLFGPVLLNNPGYIKIIVAGYSIEMTLLGLVIALSLVIFAAVLVNYVLRKLLSWQKWSFSFFQLRRQKKAKSAFSYGLQAYARQQWQEASEQLQHSFADPQFLAEKRVLASYASFYAGNTQQAINLALTLDGSTSASAFVQADLLLQQGQAGKASQLLVEHLSDAKHDPALGQLYLQALQQAGQWQALLETLPKALNEEWFSKESWQQRRFAIYPAAISALSLQGFSEQAAYWQQLPAKERKSVAAILGIAWALARQGQNELAEQRLVQVLSFEQLPLAWPYLKQIPLNRAVLKLRKLAQQWLRDNPASGYLYAFLAYLAEQEGDKEQAVIAWQKVRQLQPDLWQRE